MSHDPDVEAIRAKLVGQEERIARLLLPDGQARGHDWEALNPARPDTHLGSFSVAITGPDAGAWYDFATDASGDLFELVRMVTGSTFPEAKQWLAHHLGMEASAPQLKIPRLTAGQLAEWKRRESSGESRARGCTLAELATAKGLPVAFLTGLGLQDLPALPPTDGGDGLPAAVRIPYRNAAGETIAQRFRCDVIAKRGSRWKRGDKPTLYGLDRVKGDEQAMYLVEGESDCWCLWNAGLPALGIPGAMNWKDEWAALIPAKATVLAIQEPDNAGSELMELLRSSPLAPRLKILRLPKKDAAELWLADPDIGRFRSALSDAGSKGQRGEPEHLTAADLIDKYPTLREPIIHGLLRTTETMNLIAAAKAGKSWLVLLMALCMVTGRKWLGLPCNRCTVLIVDNELHAETLASRIRMVAQAMGLQRDDYTNLHFLCARGFAMPMSNIGRWLDNKWSEIAPEVVIVDAYYRAMEAKMEENNNSDQTQMFNTIDAIASRTGAAIINVHHESKGNQSDKKVTDVGSGGGAMGRAADAHVILRRHDEPGCVVMEAACRSWPPMDPVGLRFDWPLWAVDSSLDVKRLEGRKAKSKPSLITTPEDFAMHYIGPDPQARDVILCAAEADGITASKAKQLLAAAVASRLAYIHQRPGGTGRPATYADVPPAVEASAAEQIAAYRLQHPDAETGAIATALRLTPRTVRRVLNPFRKAS